MGIRIASFNIQKFSRDSLSSNEGKDLDMIAKIIKDNKFDIVAIQEIYHKEVLKQLLEKISSQYAERLKTNKTILGVVNSSKMNESFGYRTKHWEGRWASPLSYYGGNVVEGYAFIWNRDRIKLVTNTKNEIFEPRIENITRKKGNLVRPPLLGRFMPVNGRYEIRLINTHIAFGVPSKTKNEDDELYNPDISDIQFRKKEFHTLIESVYTRFAQKIYDTNREDRNAKFLYPYTFLLGDYNLNLHDSATSVAKLSVNDEVVDVDGLTIVTVNKELTTLKNKPADPEKQRMLKNDPVISHHLANNYDHFSYDMNKYEVQPKCGVVYAFNEYISSESETDSKYDIYRSKVSDHIPIYLEFDIRDKYKNR